MKLFASLLIVFTALAGTWNIAKAVETLDQENLPLNFTVTRGNIADVQQTITTGISGQLLKIELQLQPGFGFSTGFYTLTTTIYDEFLGGFIASDTIDIFPNTPGVTVTFDFSDDEVFFNSGDVFAIGWNWTSTNVPTPDLDIKRIPRSSYSRGELLPINGSESFFDALFRTFVDVPVVGVDIDIQPGSDQNVINLGSMGTTLVAIFGSIELDVNDINQDTLMLGTSGVKTVGKSSKLLCSINDIGDVSGGGPDGFDDLLCHFVTLGLVPEEGTTEVKLSADFIVTDPPRAETMIEGADTVNIVQE